MHRSVPRIAVGAIAVAVISISAVAAAAPGELDTSFSNDGIAVVDFGLPGQEFQRGTRDGHGVVAVGEADGDFAVARLLRGGALDADFGKGGRRIVDFGNDDAAYSAVIHRDGRISVVGFANDALGESRLAVARFKPGGGLDRTFSRDGLMTVRSPDGDPTAGYDAALTHDGKLVVVGETFDGTAGTFFAVRVHESGRLDRTFGGDGRVLVNLGSGADGAWTALLADHGRIVLAGWSEDGVGGDTRSAVVRLLPDGRRDRSFSGDGIWVQDLSPSGDDDVVGMDRTDHDRLLLGIDLFATGEDPHVVRLRPSGAYDTSFGGGDGISSNWADGFRLVDLGIRADGRISGALIAGNIASFRLGPGGAPLASYGTNGLVFTSTPMNAESMFLDGKDRPVIVSSQAGEPQVVRLQQ